MPVSFQQVSFCLGFFPPLSGKADAVEEDGHGAVGKTEESAVMARWQVLDLRVSSTIARAGNLHILFYSFDIFCKEYECLHTCRNEALRKMSCGHLQAVSKRSSVSCVLVLAIQQLPSRC